MVKKEHKLEKLFKKCKKIEDYVQFALENNANVRHKKHWVITHKTGHITILSSTSNPKKGLDMTRKEFAHIYKLEHLIH